MEHWFGKKLWARVGLFAAAIAVIFLILPRANHKSYTYEVNQPWKYPLLTAEYDVKVYPDSAAMQIIRDSIDANFIPFVKHLNKVQSENVAQLSRVLRDSVPYRDVVLLSGLVDHVFEKGLMETGVANQVNKIRKSRVRAKTAQDTTLVVVKDASDMFSITSALSFIDSVYAARHGLGMADAALTPFMKAAVTEALDANYILDTYNDEKYRESEFREAYNNYGMIKAGQRIVDKGEIITPQVYNNLNTYLADLETRQQTSGSQTVLDIGRLLLIITIMVSLYMFLWHYRRAFYNSLKKMTFLLAYIALFVVFSVIMFEYVSEGLSMVPFAAVPVVIMIFFDSRTAIISLIVTVLVCSLVATYPFQFIIQEILAGIIAVMSISQLTRRSQLLQTAIITFVVYCVTYVALQFAVEGSAAHLQWRYFGYYAINAVILSFAYILILVIEKIFGFTSNVTLVELSDINNPLLRRLAREAPGTFQHSIQVSTLAAEAASAIGANTLLVRTGALYHDIGKLDAPIYYTENQHGINPHSELEPEESARKIISHIPCGIKLAKQNNLPKAIKDFIREHHGKGLAKYFYFTAVNEKGMENVDKTLYQYPGPDPQSKETAILMMADAVEAASRSLMDYSP